MGANSAALIRRRVLVPVQVLQITLFTRHSDKKSAAINNRYLDFVQTRGLIWLVNDNHVDTTLRKFWRLYTNNRPENAKYENCRLGRNDSDSRPVP